MYIIREDWHCSTGDTLDEAIKDFNENVGEFDPLVHFIYEVKEVQVKCKFEIAEE